MSLHSRHTLAGITPQRMSWLNAMHPRQTAKADSRVAATRMAATSTTETTGAPSNHAMPAATVAVAPMPCANRFGGPGTSRCCTRMSRRHDTRRQLPEGAQRRAGQHPRHEAIGERHEDPTLLDDEEDDALQDDAGRHHPGRRLVDGVRKAEDAAHGDSVGTNSRPNNSGLPTALLPEAVPGAPLASPPMTVVLTVDQGAWHGHIARVASIVGDDALIPVVKGNGYGFGRSWLARHAVAGGAATIAVGTVHELPEATGLGATVVVLTPSIGDRRRRPAR